MQRGTSYEDPGTDEKVKKVSERDPRGTVRTRGGQHVEGPRLKGRVRDLTEQGNV